MEIVLFFFLLVMFVVTLVGFLMGSKAISTMRKEVAQLTLKVSNLEATVASQREEIQALKSQVSAQPAGLPLEQIVGSLTLFRQKGLVPGLIAVGTTLFQAYWKHRRSVSGPRRPSIEAKKK